MLETGILLSLIHPRLPRLAALFFHPPAATNNFHNHISVLIPMSARLNQIENPNFRYAYQNFQEKHPLQTHSKSALIVVLAQQTAVSQLFLGYQITLFHYHCVLNLLLYF